MTGDSTLTSLLGTPAAGYTQSIYFRKAPEGAGFPFLIFAKASGVPTDSFGTPGALETDVWMIKGVDRAGSADVVESIQARVKTLLNDATLSISGATLRGLRRISDVEYPETLDGVDYHHAGALYRLTTV